MQDPSWILTGATLLAGIAGFINAVVLGCFSLPVSHMSGNSTRWILDVARGDEVDLVLISGLVGGYTAGAFLSGLIVGGRRIRSGRHYGVALMTESVILLAATWLLVNGHLWGAALAAMACGTQNGMASSYLGLDIRTTHVTGTLTDLAMMSAHWLRHRRVPGWKFGLLASILVSFIAGGYVGMRVALNVGPVALLVPSALCGATGAVYWTWRHSRRFRSALRSLSPAIP